MYIHVCLYPWSSCDRPMYSILCTCTCTQIFSCSVGKSPLVHSTLKRPITPRHPALTPGKANRAMGQFLAQMEGFRARMTKLRYTHYWAIGSAIVSLLSCLSDMPQRIESELQTPLPIRLDKTPNPASILKPVTGLKPFQTEELTMTSRRIR